MELWYYTIDTYIDSNRKSKKLKEKFVSISFVSWCVYNTPSSLLYYYVFNGFSTLFYTDFRAEKHVTNHLFSLTYVHLLANSYVEHNVIVVRSHCTIN